MSCVLSPNGAGSAAFNIFLSDSESTVVFWHLGYRMASMPNELMFEFARICVLQGFGSLSFTVPYLDTAGETIQYCGDFPSPRLSSINTRRHGSGRIGDIDIPRNKLRVGMFRETFTIFAYSVLSLCIIATLIMVMVSALHSACQALTFGLLHDIVSLLVCVLSKVRLSPKRSGNEKQVNDVPAAVQNESRPGEEQPPSSSRIRTTIQRRKSVDFDLSGHSSTGSYRRLNSYHSRRDANNNSSLLPEEDDASFEEDECKPDQPCCIIPSDDCYQVAKRVALQVRQRMVVRSDSRKSIKEHSRGSRSVLDKARHTSRRRVSMELMTTSKTTELVISVNTSLRSQPAQFTDHAIAA